ncbi:hypothetical protein RHMOL_Rhmol11G0252200 [Rhododendron molle]|uniref:Uncharacterized protein n=1 Tax=Rhododendron molle TaxID=49168 RepID=A0ACC0LVY4_RHOML|nr:hypothetical protein RHMOL_Rhmol11G0252200 [Rhododendron molle]
MGLEWMLRLKDNIEREPATTSDQLEGPQAEEEDGEFDYFAFGFYFAADFIGWGGATIIIPETSMTLSYSDHPFLLSSTASHTRAHADSL